MKISVEMILGVVAFVLFILGAKEYLLNDQKITPRVKARFRVSVLLCIVIVFNLLITKN